MISRAQCRAAGRIGILLASEARAIAVAARTGRSISPPAGVERHARACRIYAADPL